MSKFKRTLYLLTSVLLLNACAGADTRSASQSTEKIIFDTDMGSDCDDAGALGPERK